MNQPLQVLIAQTNPQVGALERNAAEIIDIIKAHQHTHDLIAFPELALTGYPLEDLVFRKELYQQVQHYLELIRQEVGDCHVIIGHPTPVDDLAHNSISIIYNHDIVRVYHKQHLPNYEVFDECRYFTPGPKDPCILTIKDQRIGICICEDLWQPGPVEDLLKSNIDVFVSVNASPFDHGKYARRETILRQYALQGVSVVYVNQVTGQDELLFDGQSIALDKTGAVCARAKAFETDVMTVTIHNDKVSGQLTPLLSKEALIYKGLVFGTREYVRKNHFPGVLLGLSGGIDSALTLCIAVDALGPEQVHAVMMPSRYSAEMSSEDAMKQIHHLKVAYADISIEPTFKLLLETLEPHFADAKGTTEENLQARIRGIILMALSNSTGNMVLTTSNKSESAVGYATLYGDMAGGLAVLKDVLKTEVYDLAKYRNSISPAIPERVITRAPSAELRPNQTDQDSLPDYAILDKIIVAFMENNKTAEEIIALGFDAKLVHRIIKLMQQSEYKRRQSAPGLKISPIAFGKDWRFPISSGFQY